MEVPTIGKGGLSLKNLTLGFDETDANNWDVVVFGTLELFGTAIGVKLELGETNGEFVVTEVGASVRGLKTGLPIGATDSFVTDLGLDIKGIPHNITGKVVLGGTFGQEITIAGREYALLQAIAQGSYTPGEIKVIGTLLLAGGVLGKVEGVLDLDWGINDYSIELTGTFLDDIFEARANLDISEKAITGLFAADIKVPGFIPLIGGRKLAEAEAIWNVPHDPDLDRFVAAWVQILGHWTAGVKYDLHTHDVTFIGGKAVAGLQADAPSDIGDHPQKYPLQFTPTAPANGGDQSVDAHGIFHVIWSPDAGVAQKIFVNAGGNSVQVWGEGVDPVSPIVDAANGLQYRVLPEHSAAGNVAIQVIPTEAAGDNPDLYARLPQADFVVTLTAEKALDVNTDKWTGIFSAPPPQGSNLNLDQHKGDALGAVADGVNPNEVTVTFDARSTDPASTRVELYYDFDGHGYDGKKFATYTGEQLAAAREGVAGSDRTSHSLKWHIGTLPSFPLHVYAVVHDAEHAPAKTATPPRRCCRTRSSPRA